MIKNFIDRLLGKGAKADTPAAEPEIPLGARTEVPAAVHGINPELLDANAVRVVKTLQEAGYAAYIVGGAVRDLLVGLRPKDFDVATNATPEQVKVLFRRAFIIGRRFRLVHVVFGRGREHETIEVSTFRAYLDAAAADTVAGNEKTSRSELDKPTADKKHVVDASGRVLRDNVWGPQVEDAARRDFTINAMYYDPLTQTVVDYHGGLADAKKRVLRMIGDPPTRYREDPVRIIRVVRFAAKLGFALDPATHAPIAEAAPLLANVPVSRLFDEMVKLMQTGHALASVEQLKKFGLIGGQGSSGPGDGRIGGGGPSGGVGAGGPREGQPGGRSLGVFPVLDAALAPARPDAARERFVRLALEDTDRRVAEGRAVAPSFMLACMLWHDVQERWSALRAGGESPFPALQLAVDAVFDARIGDISGRGKLAADMREIWLMQPRFERRTPSSVQSLIGQPRFRAGYDFLRLRADCNEVAVELADWWDDFHQGSDDERDAMLQDLRAASTQRVRREPAPLKPVAAARGATAAAAPDADRKDGGEGGEGSEVGEVGEVGEGRAERSGDSAAAPKKRRRRRRRPAGGTDGTATPAGDDAPETVTT